MDTTTLSVELFFDIFGALAQFERSLIQQRVKAKGRIGGHLRAINHEKLQAIKSALAGRMSKAAPLVEHCA